jgi:hypothetical protein
VATKKKPAQITKLAAKKELLTYWLGNHLPVGCCVDFDILKRLQFVHDKSFEPQ